LLGKANGDNEPWGYDEKAILQIIQAYLSKHPLKKIEDSRFKLLVIGNTMPDWMFRMLLACIYDVKLYNRDFDIGYYQKYCETSDSLKNFLSDPEIHIEDISDLIDNIENESETKITLFEELANKAMDLRHDIFIAHAGEDETFAGEIVDQISGLNVWWDRGENEKGEHNIRRGDQYWQNIFLAMLHSSRFAFLITKDYYEKIEKDLPKITKTQRDKVSKAVKERRHTRLSALEGELKGATIELLVANELYKSLKSFNESYKYCLPLIIVEPDRGFDDHKKVINKLIGEDNPMRDLFEGIHMIPCSKNSLDLADEIKRFCKNS